MARHELEPRAGAVHGRFSRKLPAALEIESGDSVVARTLDVTWGMEQHGEPGSARRRYEPRDPVRDDGPALVGPVVVRGAKRGATLAVEIVDLVPASWGWTVAGRGPHNGDLNRRVGVRCEEWTLVRWTIDPSAGQAESELGDRVRIAPFLGTLGLAPEAPGWHCGWTPRACGGNMDCRLLTAGSTVYFPIEADGAYLSFGDGHAQQGDGECSGTAIECPFERVELRVTARGGFPVTAPRAVTEAGDVTLGFGATLDEAAGMALSEMLDWKQSEFPESSREQVMARASIMVDLVVTQMVDPLRGVHAVWRRAREVEGSARGSHRDTSRVTHPPAAGERHSGA